MTKKKTVRRTAKPVEVSTGDLIAMICKAASERWPEDKSSPGIQISHLPPLAGKIAFDVETRQLARRMAGLDVNATKMPDKPARWYVALHRYTEAFGQGRVVEFKTENTELDLALVDVAKHVAPARPVDAARKDLAKLVSGVISFVCFVLFVCFGMTGCAAGVAQAPDLTLVDYETGVVSCEAQAPDLGYDGCDKPVEISPANPVATVCHCIGGVYACFGHPGQPTCAESK